MKNMNNMRIILENASTMECTLKTLGYAMEFISYIDHDEEKIREIANNIAGSIECLQRYQEEITDAISNVIYFEEHEIETEEPEQAPDRADEVKNLDYEKIERAALDNDRARATIGCLISALHDQGGDNETTKISETSCWQFRASLEIVYKILQETSMIFFETSEMIERMERVKDEEDHGQK